MTPLGYPLVPGFRRLCFAGTIKKAAFQEDVRSDIPLCPCVFVPYTLGASLHTFRLEGGAAAGVTQKKGQTGVFHFFFLHPPSAYATR